jgi:hypothetical protein
MADVIRLRCHKWPILYIPIKYTINKSTRVTPGDLEDWAREANQESREAFDYKIDRGVSWRVDVRRYRMARDLAWSWRRQQYNETE